MEAFVSALQYRSRREIVARSSVGWMKCGCLSGSPDLPTSSVGNHS